MPTSVLLAVLAAALLLALAPALTRRYDATERVAAERATSTARVLSRRRRRRTVPGLRPINPPRFTGLTRGASAVVSDGGLVVGRSGLAGQSGRSTAGQVSRRGTAGQPSRRGTAGQPSRRGAAGQVSRRGAAGQPPRLAAPGARGVVGKARGRKRHRPVPTALHRRRRVLLALILLNLVELAGVVLVGPGFWVSFSVSFVVLLADLVYLRHRAVVAARIRRAAQRRSRWVQAQQAAVRREHARRAAQRLAAARRAAAEREEARREAARQAIEYVERYAPRTARNS